MIPETLLFWLLFIVVSCFKLLFIPAYRSTDFEVHRNWLAITHSLPLNRWYFEETSEWTLDYPPFFAYFEWILAQIAWYFDPKMLDVANLNYASDRTILFQRLSVIAADFIYAMGVLSCVQSVKTQMQHRNPMWILSSILLFNVGLIWVDHIHFQYNGILFGVLLLSIGAIFRQEYIKSAIYFTILLNMKHIFIYFAPVYFVYLLRNYCCDKASNDRLLGSFNLHHFIKLGAVVIGITALSFGPFYNHIPQVFARLFPFKRGLSHSYWAPNFWAIYNFVDKVASIVLQRKAGNVTTSSGLVQTFDHEVLPNVTPFITFLLTGILLLPCLWKLWFTAYRMSEQQSQREDFVRALSICGLTSFMFGWHVHEKAILMVLIPISILCTNHTRAAKDTHFLSIVALYSLFPLLFPANLLAVKVTMYLTYVLYQRLIFKDMFKGFSLTWYERIYGYLLVGLFIFTEIIHPRVNFLIHRLPFLPLMLTSVYCALGVTYYWLTSFYGFIMRSEQSVKQKKVM